MTADWYEQAACSGLPTDWFFERGESPRAMAACRRCPVRRPCLEQAMLEESEFPARFVCGVRGGTLPEERRRMRRREEREG